MSDVFAEALRIERSLKRCWVCQENTTESVMLADPRVFIMGSASSTRAGRRRRVCVPCAEGREWSIKASAESEFSTYLQDYAPLLALFPAHVARCLLGNHKHPHKMPFMCLGDWQEQRRWDWKRGRGGS